MSCFSCSEIVLSTHNKLGEIMDSLSSETCPCVLQSVLDNLKLQQNDLKNLIFFARQNCTIGLRICDLDTILHSKLSQAILTVIELLAISHSQKETGAKAPQLTAHFAEINAALQVSSSDDETDTCEDIGET